MVTVTLTTSPAFRVLAAMPVAEVMATLHTVEDGVAIGFGGIAPATDGTVNVLVKNTVQHVVVGGVR
jgi:hypothetical protein